MNNNLIKLAILLALVGAGYYCYQQGCMKKESERVEEVLNAICDPAKEDCSALEDDLEV